MRLASYKIEGQPSFGIVRADGIVDLPARTGVLHIRDLLEKRSWAQAEQFTDCQIDFSVSEVTFLPVIPDPKHIICVGSNYSRHISETKDAGIKRDTPEYPSIFLRSSSSLCAHKQPLIKPKVSAKFDFEAELAIVIGVGGRYIPVSESLNHIVGVTCFNDASLRDFQFHTNNITPGKNFPSTGALGPWLETHRSTSLDNFTIEAYLNGEKVQDGNTSDMIFSIGEIISYASKIFTLAPGDVIATGTPEGVGFSRRPPLYMKEGDTFEVEIAGVGRLTNPVCAEM